MSQRMRMSQVFIDFQTQKLTPATHLHTSRGTRRRLLYCTGPHPCFFFADLRNSTPVYDWSLLGRPRSMTGGVRRRMHGEVRIPGGRHTVVVMALIGLATTLGSNAWREDRPSRRRLVHCERRAALRASAELVRRSRWRVLMSFSMTAGWM